MPVVDAQHLLQHARRHRYAVCSFEVPDLVVLQAVMDAAVQADAPLLLAVAADAPGALDHRVAAVEAAAAAAALPVAILLSRVRSSSEAARGINLGCNAITLATDAGETAAIHAVAQRCAVPVLDVAAAGPDVVQKDYDRCIAAGIAAVHHGHLADAALQQARSATNYAEFTLSARAALQADVARHLHWSGSAGQGAAALRDVPRFHPVEHCIVYNVDAAHAARVDEIMARGRQVRREIPGVRAVFTGRAETANAKYQYCWLVRFAHPAVIDSYRDHPDHVGFANEHFRPIAADRLTIDFRCVE
jgi:fructose-bisphosphate aldolase, class II